jgi:aldose 1-epimerase
MRFTLLSLVTLFVSAFAAESRVERAPFVTLPDGRVVEVFTLRNAGGASVAVLTYGAILADIQMPDRAGHIGPVLRPTLATPEAAARGFPGSGAIMGRVTNRIANASFELDGRTYTLAANAKPHHIHGGNLGFSRVNWSVANSGADASGAWVELAHVSPDGDEGYPGELRVTVRTTLTADNTVRLNYRATTNAPTIVNLTNHAYFNLAGGGDVVDHEMQLAAAQYTEVDAKLIPTGRLLPVKDTALDFSTFTRLGARAAALGPKHIYDHNFVLDRKAGDTGLLKAAVVREAKTGRTLETWTTEPGVQVYTSPLDGSAPAGQFGFFCLETQHFPDAIHHPHFNSVVLRPGQEFRSTTEYRFRTP